VVPIEGVDFLDAGIANDQWRIVRRQAAPVSEGSARGLKSLQAEDALEFAVADLHAEEALLVVENPVKIQVVSVS